MNDLTILRQIEAVDPDGWEREPTDTDRRKFEEWVRDICGERIATIYFRGGWDPQQTNREV
jgi:hypothetical protein